MEPRRSALRFRRSTPHLLNAKFHWTETGHEGGLASVLHERYRNTEAWQTGEAYQGFQQPSGQDVR